MASYNTIKVVARFRPPNKLELASGGETVVDFESEDTCNVQTRDGSGAFTFDRIFDMNSQQTDVFDFSIRSTVDDILNGYNGTVFAYGQTGAGKSYTMMGADIYDENVKGVIPRIVEQIFTNILTSSGNMEYTVRVSYMEIYMERIRDLLQPMNDNLPIHEEKSRGVYVKGLLEIYVSSVAEVYEVMRRGGLARATAATNMNQESSRSHSIFVITVAQKNLETGSAKSGQLFLVDLAGSEKVGKTGASGQTLEEAKKINKSLSALGMVINSLTDGKSTHIPYRDSKLTRILQESLGGNSRTTLIINCSPNSYNAEETLSTLRFGVRAKKIQNKAKINTELSPAELKALLKKAQTQVTTYEDYMSNLESELFLWRQGESVPQERWTPARSKAVERGRKPVMPATPSRMTSSDGRRADTPSRPDSGLDLDRAVTPSVVLEKDEREEFLRRENELQDQLADKESQVINAELELTQARDELKALKLQFKQAANENERLHGETDEFRIQVEKINFESKESLIVIDGLKEANAELTAELDDVKHQLLDAKISVSKASAVLDEKERKKAERMAQMMAGFDLNGDAVGQNELKVLRIIDHVSVLHELIAEGDTIRLDELEETKNMLVDAQRTIRQTELSLASKAENDDLAMSRIGALEEQLADVQKEYEDLLESGLSRLDIDDVKRRLVDIYVDRQSSSDDLVHHLNEDLLRSREQNQRTQMELETLQQQVNSGAATSNGAMANGTDGKTIEQQTSEFETTKKSLMRDLQNRCERVVELEISLDEAREQYNHVLRTSSTRAQQKKMALLEHNLERLMHVQQEMKDQNHSLKQEVAIAERKLLARNKRIEGLENLLQESQEKLTTANCNFEAQLTAIKDRLETARLGSTRGLASFTNSNGGFNLSGGGSRIAKPLRGGGVDMNGGPLVPTFSNLQAQDGGKQRASWFFNQRA